MIDLKKYMPALQCYTCYNVTLGKRVEGRIGPGIKGLRGLCINTESLCIRGLHLL